MDASWFDVDKEGLGKLVERRGKHWLLAELLQNAWDAPGVSFVDVLIVPEPGTPFCLVRVEDDSPDGFQHLEHAFTLFAESIKKGDPTLRGRFNLGEKLVLALAREATLHTTCGTVHFGKEGRSVNRRNKRDRGTVFEASVRMTRAEMSEVMATADTYIPPPGITTHINGTPIAMRAPLADCRLALITEAADAQGMLRRTRRTCSVGIYAPLEGQPARLYEMGIPVMDLLDDAYDIDVGQKVPLSLDRDAVSPAYLREVRVGVLNRMADALTNDAAAAPWVGDALTSASCEDSAVRAVVERRFGDQAVSYDPSDLESNHRAVAQGYTVVPGGFFSAEQWKQIRRAEALRPAGRVVPTPRPFGDGPAARRVTTTPEMEAFAEWLADFGESMIGRRVTTEFLLEFNGTAAYGNGQVCFNVKRLGKAWFQGPLNERHLDLVLHELAHEYEPNHLSERYYNALTKLGARATLLALDQPRLFALDIADRADTTPQASMRIG